MHERGIRDSRDRTYKDAGLMDMNIIISDKYKIVLDPRTLTVGEAAPNVYILNLAPIKEKIDDLEKISDDLMGCLDPYSGMLDSQPNREGSLGRAGFVTMMIVGLTAGLGILALILFSI
ncbi:MAG: tetrahydromethanopterin S-methyltransferase subunit B [Candidatus Methanolliviera hydrocarbonicum]|uniref:Tetrahydromethanopterin S-methyltransferase subunit B n=1 Tax=Candidatus Methanolliviera hydrocarbonicum TaxID=2491085 RepID=A0A520KW39_9EURY|nr:MAG: tetrahydromethanopterin S-methyltransferase subunit B [Candidatus Methanolliviera hydrocarbonicum]